MSPSTASLVRLSRPLALATLSLATTATFAQTTPQTDGRWHGDISIGGSAASGNTSATSLALRAEATRATDVDKLGTALLVNYGSSKSGGVRTRSAELARLSGRYDRNLTDSTFAFGGGEAEVNKPGGVKSRLSLNLGGGLHVLREPRSTWDLFAGLGHSGTRFTDGSSRNGAELLLGEESTHRIGESTSFKQRLAVYTGASRIGHRATFDANLATAILGGWTMNTGLALRYASKVAPGLKSSDSLLTVGFGYKF